MNWTQPLCDECYAKIRPGIVPVILTEPDPHKCCQCGEMTDYPVWYRLDPKTVRFPYEEKGDA